MIPYALLVLALWIVTHTIAKEIPVTANARKPFSCQLCLSGWGSILTGVWTSVRAGDPWMMVPALAMWALAVLIEAFYQRLQTFVL